MPPQDDAKNPDRPSPDALLAEAAREHRGRLKIFLGADVVAGIVESHGRQETGALTRGLETIPRRPLWPYCASTLMVAGALGVGFGIDQLVDVPNLSLVFLMAVLGSATLYGLKASLYASLLSVATYNFFFVPPLYSFTVADPANAVALVFFFLASVLTSQLAAVSRSQVASARRRAKATAELYAFSRKLTGIGDLDDLLWATAHQVAMMLKLRVVILMPAKDGLVVRTGYPPEDRLTEADVAAAQWSWDHNKPAGRGAETLPGARWLFLPLRTERGAVAVIGLTADRSGPLLTPDERRLIDALADQATIAIERIALAGHVDENRILAETERLRSALLSSLSHDLRTPLSSIMGAATSLQRQAGGFDAAVRAELVDTIRNEAERMNRFVNNLLDMTRIESGALAAKREIVDLADAVGTALERMARTLAEHRVEVGMPADLPMVRGDFVLLEQVVANLLDNAAKYAPPGSTITLRGQRGPDGILLTVADEGPGIPADRLQLVFDKFYRVHATDRQRAGTGLCLAICRGFIEAMGGSIVAANRLDRSGALLAVTLPIGMEMPSETTLMEAAP